MLSKAEANRRFIVKSHSTVALPELCFHIDTMMQGKENVGIIKLTRLEMVEFLQGVFMLVEISITNCMAHQRCNLVQLDHASVNFLLRKQRLL